jgi:hypothetical protein
VSTRRQREREGKKTHDAEIVSEGSAQTANEGTSESTGEPPIVVVGPQLGAYGGGREVEEESVKVRGKDKGAAREGENAWQGREDRRE